MVIRCDEIGGQIKSPQITLLPTSFLVTFGGKLVIVTTFPPPPFSQCLASQIVSFVENNNCSVANGLHRSPLLVGSSSHCRAEGGW